MPKISAWAEARIMPTIFMGADCPPPPTDHVCKLFKTAVTETGSGTEITGGGYAPFLVTFGAPAQVAGTEDYQCVNPARIESVLATTAWDLDVTYGIYDAAGNFLFYGDVAKLMTPPVGVAIGDRWKAEPGALFFKVIGALSAPMKIALLNWMVGGQSFTPLTASKLALYDASGTELSGNGYARLDITLGALTDDGAGSHYYANATALTATFSGSVTVGQVGLLTASGTVIQKGPLPQVKTFGPGIDFTMDAGSFQFKLG